MADQEVIKHFKKMYQVWSSKSVSLWQKVKGIGLEILIIVFAVSLSIWLHGWSEHRHQQQEVRSFLLGLKQDIQEDITETRDLINSFHHYGSMYTYFYKLRRDREPHADSLHTYLQGINGNAYLRPNNTRFNSFLSSGKIGYIEDDSLALQILQLYQEYLPRIKSSEEGWVRRNHQLNEYLVDLVQDIDSDRAQWEVLITPKAKYLSKLLIPHQQLYDRYADFVRNGEHIIRRIEEKYPPE